MILLRRELRPSTGILTAALAVLATGGGDTLVGMLRRPDGSTQLSYGGHPLYTYDLDATPGIVTGQAINQDGGLWYVLNGKGKQVTTAFSVTSPNVNPNS